MDLLSIEDNSSPGPATRRAMSNSGNITFSSTNGTNAAGVGSTQTIPESDEDVIDGLLKIALTSPPNERCLLYESAVLKVSTLFEYRAHRVSLLYNSTQFNLFA